MPAFSSPVDCTPWVIGGLWPAEFSSITDENAMLAKHLKADLQRITSRTNDELKVIKRAGMADAARQAAETRAIDEARAHAARRVESAVRHLHTMKAAGRPAYPRPRLPQRPARGDLDKTLVMPAVPAVPIDGSADEKTEVIAAVPAVEPAGDEEPGDEEEAAAGRHRFPGDDDDAAETAVLPELHGPAEVVDADAETTRLQGLTAFDETVADDAEAFGGRHRVSGGDDDAPETADLPAPPGPVEVVEPEPETIRLQGLIAADAIAAMDPEPTVDAVADQPAQEDDEDEEAEAVADDTDAPAEDGPAPEPQTATTSEPQVPVAEPQAPVAQSALPPVPAESDGERLQRLLSFVVRQEPKLNWAVGDRADGTTLLVTDLAHGWIPPGITLPADVCLLQPGRRTGKVPALLGETTRAVTYTPGDPVGRSADFAETEPSVQPRALPAVADLGWELGQITHWRDGLPRLVHTLAKAATSGTGVVEDEADLLRVHLDTARYQVLTQYPDIDPALLLNCLLLATTDSSVAGDRVSANYHFAWFQKLDERPVSQWTTES